MEVKVQMPFHQLVEIIKQLSPSQKAKIQKELDAADRETAPEQKSFTELLLNGPVFSDDQLKAIEETRKSINQWRTK